jgi:carotenoid cleavage dioxygenase-like enzyme
MAADHRLGFRPAREEVAMTLPVEGEVPEWLSGTLLRNGPGTWSAGRQPLTHWFDGLAMIRRFRIADGEVAYANRFLDSEAYRYARKHGELGYREFATDPPEGVLGALGRLRRLRSPEFTDNACVDICRVGDRYLAMTESPLVTEIDPDTLETRRRYRFGEFSDTITVHPHYDFQERELLGYGTRFGGTSDGGYTIYSVPDGGENVSILGEIASDPPGYLHSFALTPRYVVLTEPPFVPSRLGLLTGSSVIDSYEWRPERGTRFHVVSRESGEVRARHRVPPFFTFHHVNAFEREENGSEGGRTVVVDLIAYEDASVVEALRLGRLVASNPSLPTGELRRFELPVDGRRDHGGSNDSSGDSGEKVERETIYPGHIELPMIDYEHRNTREYRYAYGVGNDERPPQGFQNQLVKVDVRERKAETWHAEGTYPGEPVFVPAPGEERKEDEGTLLSVVLDAGRERSFLLVLDAATMDERARAWCPHPIPFGFHGQFYADGETRPTRSMA